MTALAQASGEPDASAPPASESGDSTDQEPDACVFEDWEPTPEERAWIEAENDVLRAAFDATGIAFTVELDEEIGVEFVEWNFDDDRANEVTEESLAEFWDTVDAAELQAENDALREAFDAEGIPYTLVPDEEGGGEFVQWGFDDDSANEIADRVFAELYGDMELSDEEKAEVNTETEGLAAAFDAAGISYMVFHDNERDVRFVDWDDDEFAAQVLGELYGDDVDDLFEDCVVEPSAEEQAKWQAVGDELAKRLEAAGIAFERVEDASGVTFPE